MNGLERFIAISLGAIGVAFLIGRAVSIWQDASQTGKVLTNGGVPQEWDDAIDEASEESFPASDPPARTPVSGVGRRH